MLVFSLFVHADQAPKTPAEIPPFKPAFTCGAQDVPKNCDDAKARLQMYGENILKHTNSLFTYVSSVKDTTQSWYDDQFGPIERGEIPLNDTIFEYIPDNLTKIDVASDYARATRDCMKDELDKILLGMQNCKNIGE